MSVLLDAAQNVQHLAAKYDGAIVAFSGGKDSLVVLDMARRCFKRVVGLFMYFVPDLQCDADRLAIAKTWGIEVLQYPHFSFLEAMGCGAYCVKRPMPELTRYDIYEMCRADTGMRCVLTGIKKSDSMARRKPSKMTSADVFHPIIEWKDFDVLAYCGYHKIDLPKTPTGRKSSGVDLRGESLLFLHENFPDDFKRLCEFFPFAEAVLWRERWHYEYTGAVEQSE